MNPMHTAELQIRTPTLDERPQVIECMRVALNTPSWFAERRGPLLDPNDFLAAFDHDHVVGIAGARVFTQFFGGGELPMSGVTTVGVLPEHRGSGIASRLVADVLRRDRANGALVSSLYPAALRPYRALGFELAGTFTEHRAPLEDLPVFGGRLPVRELTPEDIPGVRACYRRTVEKDNGPIDGDDTWWWRDRKLAHVVPDKLYRTVVVRGAEGIEGFASFHNAEASEVPEYLFRLEGQFTAATPDALRTLLDYFRGFRGMGVSLTWTGPPVDPVALKTLLATFEAWS